MHKQKSIRSSIRRGSLAILAGGLVITLFFTAALFFISVAQKNEVIFSENLAMASDSLIEVNSIYRSTEDVILNSGGSVSTSTPTFDKLKNINVDNKDIENYTGEAVKLHGEFISSVKAVLEQYKTDPMAAQEMYKTQTNTALGALADKIHDITAKYSEMTEMASGVVSTVINVSVILGVVFLVLLTGYSLVITKKMAKNIAMPVIDVANWAEELATGADHIEELDKEADTGLVEIHRMVGAFKAMSESIKENVDVVRKVADGDMTAYVNIRSSKDSLGKSLYKMVQSNDIMFAQITQIADSVREGTDAISHAAKLLAENCTEQANAIENFQEDINSTNELIKNNAEAANHASELSDAIRGEVAESKEKMTELVDAMKAINEASEKVAGVIANIENIADQTSLLAINASIEAARVGEAGKGFAVVAGSVKELAVQSAQSVTQTRALIDDTIAKSKRGSQLSDETFKSFETIIESLEQIVDVSAQIASSGSKQQDSMSDIAAQIDDISRAVSTNAASSEETASMTVEITQNVEVLKSSMNQFNLRKREFGKPYIPPEKANDQEFIRAATANYNRFINSPEGKKIVEELKLDSRS